MAVHFPMAAHEAVVTTGHQLLTFFTHPTGGNILHGHHIGEADSVGGFTVTHNPSFAFLEAL